jgi:type VI secretion system protein ImpC
MAKLTFQKFLGRRPPPKRVRFRLEIELGGEGREVELPFVIGVLADLRGASRAPERPIDERRMLEIDVDNFEQRMREVEPRIDVPVPCSLGGSAELRVDITFRSLDDFTPGAVARAIPSLTAALPNADSRPGVHAQLNAVLHHPEFRRLESSWRGLHYLVSHAETDSSLKVRFASVTKSELGELFERHADGQWASNSLFAKLCKTEFDMLGGEPYGCIIGDYEFGPSPLDVKLLGGMAQIAAAAHAPFLAAASPLAMGRRHWREVQRRRGEPRPSGPEHAAWRSLRQSEDARYVVLTAPRFLARLPYGADDPLGSGFAFEEEPYDPDGDNLVWASSAYALGANVARAFKRDGWFAAITGFENGRVEDVPAFPLGRDSASPCSTEAMIGEVTDVALSHEGIAPLVHSMTGDTPVFLDVPCLQKPPTYESADATTTAALAARLPYLLAVSRVVHYLKQLLVRQIGASMELDDLQKFLNAWLAKYVDPAGEHASVDEQAAKPLTYAEIVLTESLGRPGKIIGKLRILPYYRLHAAPLPFTVMVRFDI